MARFIITGKNNEIARDAFARSARSLGDYSGSLLRAVTNSRMSREYAGGGPVHPQHTAELSSHLSTATGATPPVANLGAV